MLTFGNKFGLRKCAVILAGSAELIGVYWAEFKRRLLSYVRDEHQATLQPDRNGRLVLGGGWPTIIFREGELEIKGDHYVAKDLRDETFGQLLKRVIPKFIERIHAMRTDIKLQKFEDSISELDPRKESLAAYLSYL